MPPEVLLKIFSFVKEETLFALPRVCRRWRLICRRLAIEEIKWKHHPMKIEAFVVMLGKFGRIESLDLDNCVRVTDAGISKIGEGCRQLRSLDLYHCRQVTALSNGGIMRVRGRQRRPNPRKVFLAHFA